MTTMAFLPPSSRRQPLQAAPGALRDGRAGAAVAREADDGHVRALDEGRAHRLAGARDEVDDARREARLVQQLDEQGAHSRACPTRA